MSPEAKFLFFFLALSFAMIIFVVGCAPEVPCKCGDQCPCKPKQEHEGHFGAAPLPVEQVLSIDGQPTAAMPGHVLSTLKSTRDRMQ